MKEITVQELKAMQDRNEDFQLIDVREDFEYQESNLGAVHIPLGQILAEADKIDRNKPVVIHCRSGKRSAQAVQILSKREGFDNLSNLKGGILAWRDEMDPDLKVY
ncbi:MAG TPA: rhodanese-like domain-containing protein [Sphingobacteriaceae bacterium]|nr:rhodanese-like domain-containing protein [Sphingobacteriaceae bacterium]